MATFREVLLGSPRLFPLVLDPMREIVQFIELDEADYHTASFLDHRSRWEGRPRPAIPWGELQKLADDLMPKCHFLFHISHCGSTLISRLLGMHPAFFCLREPAILRLMATDAKWREPRPLRTFLGLWSRTFQPGRTAIIKATSFASGIAEELMSSVPGSKAVLIAIPLVSFLAALLDGSQSDILDQAENRRRRLELLIGTFDRPTSIGEWTAMSWCCEMLTLLKLNQQEPTETHWLDFEAFLKAPADGLAEICRLFGAAAPDTDTWIGSALRSGELARYSKRPEQQYDAHFRARLLAKSFEEHRSEIERGQDWYRRTIMHRSERSYLEALFDHHERGDHAIPSM